MVGGVLQSRGSLILEDKAEKWRLGFTIFNSFGGARHDIPGPRSSCDILCKPNKNKFYSSGVQQK